MRSKPFHHEEELSTINQKRTQHHNIHNKVPAKTCTHPNELCHDKKLARAVLYNHKNEAKNEFNPIITDLFFERVVETNPYKKATSSLTA